MERLMLLALLVVAVILPSCGGPSEVTEKLEGYPYWPLPQTCDECGLPSGSHLLVFGTPGGVYTLHRELKTTVKPRVYMLCPQSNRDPRWKEAFP